MDKRDRVIVVAFCLVLVFTCVCSFVNYQLFKSLEGRVNTQPTSTPSTATPTPTITPTPTTNPTPTTSTKPQSYDKNASIDQYGKNNTLFYAVELNLKNGLQENDFKNTAALNDSNQLYYYRAFPIDDNTSVWIQAFYNAPLSSEQKAAATALSDSRGTQTYTWHIDEYTINYIDFASQRGGLMPMYVNKDMLLAQFLPNYEEAAQW